MSRKQLLFVALTFAIFLFASIDASAAGKPSKMTAHPAPPSQQRALSNPNTPLNRTLMPYLRKRLKSQATAGARQHSLAPSDASPLSAPNFAGFVNAPYYPARLEPSCVTDPYNCGVIAEVGGDFDKDGKPDVAVLQADGTLNVLFNDGKGGLKTPVAYANPNFGSTFIQQAFAVDLNKDGYDDILAYDDSNNALIIYLNQKDGTFGSPQTINLTYDYGNVACIALGDVNGDGNLDVLTIASNLTSVTSTDVTVQTLFGNGDGTFQSPTAFLTHTVSVPSQVQVPGGFGISVGDLNGDGKLDIAAVFEEYDSFNTGKLVTSVAIGNGDGTFGALNVHNPVSVNLSSPTRLLIDSAGAQIVDLNKDSKADLAVDTAGILYVALGDGAGGFTSVVKTQDVAASDQIIYTDINGDGTVDIVQENGVLNIWLGNGDGTFTQPANGYAYVVDGGELEGMVLADFNGDGHPDIAQLGGDYKQVSMFTGDGKGNFHGAPVLDTTTDTLPSATFLFLETTADLKGNGLSDAVYIDDSDFTAPYVVTGLSDGKGNFAYTSALPASAVPDIAYIQPLQADFNGDGKQDIVITGTKGDLYVALSKGDGTFQTPAALALPSLNCFLNYAAAADLNGDGHTDLVIPYPGDASCGGGGSTPSGYFVALGKGDGTFSTPVFTSAGAELYAVTIADMNSDGVPDLLLDDVPTNVLGDFAVYLNPGNGDGTFAQGTAVNSDYIVSQVIAGDYNQDGKTDLILLSEGEETDLNFDKTAGILLVPGKGDGTFGDSSQLATGNFFLNGTLADVNSDGIPDLTVALYTTVGQPNTYYGLSTLIGEGGGAFSAPVNQLESLESVVPMAGNFYADNAPDIIVSTPYGTALYIGQGGSTLTLTTSDASVAFGTSETFTATLTPSMTGRPAPTGNISFYDGSTLLGTAPLSGATATFSTSALGVGAHNIMAVYAGDANSNPNTSAASTVTVTAVTPAFTLTASNSSLTVTRGSDATVTLTLAANAAFSGTVNLVCSGAPANSACVVNPATATLAAGGTATASLVIGTTTGKAANRNSPLLPGSLGVLSLSAIFCVFRRRSIPRAFMVFAIVALSLAGIALSGCGGSSIPTAAKGTYTLKVTATPSASGAAAQTTNVSVTIQ